MLIFLLSLAGLPPTAGFFAKLLIFWSLLETGHPYLALAGALYILPAVYYYFRIVAAMWTSDSSDASQSAQLPLVVTATQKYALAAAAAITLAAGIFPEQFLRFAKSSILGSFGL
jgi:NADH-quinone oxidoreductase subunit N